MIFFGARASVVIDVLINIRSRRYAGKRYAIIGALKGNLASDRKCSEPSAYPNCQYVSVPLETGVTVPGLRTNCTPAGKMNGVGEGGDTIIT